VSRVGLLRSASQRLPAGVADPIQAFLSHLETTASSATPYAVLLRLARPRRRSD
jgi:hypothetical protein